MEAWNRNLTAMSPPDAPTLTVAFPTGPRRRFPDTLPHGVERYFLVYEARERMLTDPQNQGWWEALRRAQGKQRPRNIPTEVGVRLPDDLWSTGP
jgi:hypothetical protein